MENSFGTSEKPTQGGIISVGCQSLDAEHRELVAAIDETCLVLAAGKESLQPTRVLQLLDHIRDLTAKHFTNEETILDFVKYPQLEAHREIHRSLLQGMEELQNGFDTDAPLEDVLAVLEFFRQWWFTHINLTDAHFRGYVTNFDSATFSKGSPVSGGG